MRTVIGMTVLLALLWAASAPGAAGAGQPAPAAARADTASAVDVAAADALIRRVFSRRNGLQYERATAAYLDLLGAIGTPLTAPECEILDAHLRALAPILPDSLRRPLTAPDEEVDGDESLPPITPTLDRPYARTLVAWWRGQDPLPTTRANERAEEHLERVLFVWEEYRRRDGRLDDRGPIYLRLGAPFWVKDLDFDSAELRRKVFNRNPNLNYFDFRPGELWVYRHIDYAAHYLFVEERDGEYRLAEPLDLLPSNLTHGFAPSQRGHQRAEAFLRAVAELYGQLALYHIDYATIYNDAANYATSIDMARFSGSRSPDLRNMPPASFASSLTSSARSEAFQHRRRRRDDVPRVYTRMRSVTDPLPMSTRVARFLNPDRTTRTEIYWGTTTTAFQPPEDILERFEDETDSLTQRYMLATTATQWGANYEEQRVRRRRQIIDTGLRGGTRLLEPQTFVAPRASGRYHLGLQWDAYMVFPDAGPTGYPRLGPRIQTAVFRVDSLQALTNDPALLEVSDLKPVVASATLRDPAEAIPYPFARITPSASLGLYFEIYHLGYGDDDQARYTVTYDVQRRTQRGALRQLFQGDDVRRTTTSAAQTAATRTTQEFILLDLTDWPPGTEGEITVSVTVTDEITGQQVERALTFELAATSSGDS